MIVYFVFLLIKIRYVVTIGFYDTYVPDDYLYYPRHDDIAHKEKQILKFDDIKYNDLLNLLHNEYSNKAILTHIEKTHRFDNDFERLKRENSNMPANTTVKDVKDILEPDKLNDTDKAAKPNITKTKSHNDTKTNVDNMLKGDKELGNKKRDTRSVLKILRNMFHSDTTAKPKEPVRAIQRYLRLSPDVNVYSSFAELVQNLTESVRLLNVNLAKLKKQAREKVGFILIQIPLDTINETKFIQNNNGTINRSNSGRRKRDTPENKYVNSKIDVNGTYTKIQNNSVSLNVTNDSRGIEYAKKQINPTNLSKSESISEANELNKSKRHANMTKPEMKNSKLLKPKTNKNASRSDNTNLAKSKENAAYNLTNILNTTENVSKKTDLSTKGQVRRFLDSKDELLFHIEEAYNDIKNLILPIADVKTKYSEVIMYKIGYIIAHLDTMATTLTKLNNRIFFNTNSWEVNKLQKVFRKLSLSKKLVENVMQYLNNYEKNLQLLSKKY